MNLKVLQVSSQEILESIDAGFSEAYKPFSTYQKENNELWHRCINIISNSDLMNKIIFCNDILEIPPVKVFIVLNENLNTLTTYDKKFIGAFFGYVFKFVLGYKGQKQVGINNKNIKTATYFFNKDTIIQVVQDNLMSK